MDGVAHESCPRGLRQLPLQILTADLGLRLRAQKVVHRFGQGHLSRSGEVDRIFRYREHRMIVDPEDQNDSYRELLECGVYLQRGHTSKPTLGPSGEGRSLQRTEKCGNCGVRRPARTRRRTRLIRNEVLGLPGHSWSKVRIERVILSRSIME
ncbi:hypothetical protein BD310DRAFT_676321 [Dichomitus squalens]|uniref:Uncharacterized protein n=1 Tax=Dichomitus squalens TaxID=114155 RepID=A0A4V2K7D0_9APHY|nr:hypothetical protein BD310DRAFT_676321 [Dichomitus squalens]